MLLEALDVTSGYGGRAVLQGVRAELQTGEFVGLIGPNGSGKSTLLRTLSGYLRPQSGVVLLDDQDLHTLAPNDRARCIGFVPQSEKAAFDFTVKEVIMMGRYPHQARFGAPTPEDYRRVKRALADTDLLHLENRPVTRLSGGEHRRVLLARALAQDAPLLLLDEPTAHLDITHQAELLTLVRQATRSAEGKIGALAALHDLNQAAEFCDRLILLAEGQVVAEGTPDQVLTDLNLRRVYNAYVQVGRNPVTGRPQILSIEASGVRQTREGLPQIHVICGGGAGLTILNTLAHIGFPITAGVLNRLDSDQEAAEALGIETALESPYSPFGSDACDEARRLIAQADLLIVAPVPFGHGNLPNLELAIEAQTSGKPVLLIGDEPFEERDFVGGVAYRLFQNLLDNGAQPFDRLEDWPGLYQSDNSPPPGAGPSALIGSKETV